MNKRIKEVRKTLNLTQKKFGEKVGVTEGAFSNIEKGNRNVTEQMFKSICREFNVNEEWLRTGNGKMFKKENLFSLDEFLKKQEATDLEIEIVKLLFSFDKNTRGELISKLKNIFQSETNINELSDTKKNLEKEKLNNQITEKKVENEITNYKSELSKKVNEKKITDTETKKYPIYRVPARGSKTGYFEFEMTDEMLKGFEEDLNSATDDDDPNLC